LLANKRFERNVEDIDLDIYHEKVPLETLKIFHFVIKNVPRAQGSLGIFLK
jgi:hypothetical protein